MSVVESSSRDSKEGACPALMLYLIHSYFLLRALRDQYSQRPAPAQALLPGCLSLAFNYKPPSEGLKASIQTREELLHIDSETGD